MNGNSKKKPPEGDSRGSTGPGYSLKTAMQGVFNEHGYSIRNENKCVVCDEQLPDDGDSIQCELCDTWYCVPCSGMTNTFYQELVAEENNGNCLWYCNGCKKAIPVVRKVLNMVSLMKNSQDTMIGRIERIESQLKNVGSNAELNMEFKLDQAIMDMRERENRKTNVVIYNLAESKAESSEVRKTDDLTAVEDLCGSVQVSDKPRETIRLREKRNAKARPVKVIFETEQAKHNLLKNNSKFTDKIQVTPDYTFRQRQMNNKMKEEVAKRRAADPTFTYKKLKDELNSKQNPDQTCTSAEQTRYSKSPRSTREELPGRSMRPRNGTNKSPSQSQRNKEQGRSETSSSQIPKIVHKNGGATGTGPPLGRGRGTGQGPGRGSLRGSRR